VRSSLFLPRPFRTGAATFAALAVAGWVLAPLERSAWAQVAANAPELRADTLAGDLGQGAVVGLLGGFRSLVADFVYLKAWSDWDEHDLRGTVTHLRLTTAIDPRPVYFWINGARMMANDMPGWRVEQAGGWETVPVAVQRTFAREQAALGIAYLEEGLRANPNSPLLHLEIAYTQLNRLLRVANDAGDPEAARQAMLRAADAFGRAAALPGAPYVAARMRGRWLAKAGRPREALDWLVKFYPTLPKPSASVVASSDGQPTEDDLRGYAREDTLGLIREIEQELKVPPEQAFRP
jgi:hypothetical protein